MDVAVVMYYVTIVSFILHVVTLKVEPIKPKLHKIKQEDDDVMSSHGFTWSDYKGEEWQFVRIKKIPSRRHRRHLSGSNNQIEQYRFNGFGRHFRLRLKPNRLMLSPNFSIYRNTLNGSVESVHDYNVECRHLIGRLQGNLSVVALSSCPDKGMTGYIRTNQEYFYIEPATEGDKFILHRKQIDGINDKILRPEHHREKLRRKRSLPNGKKLANEPKKTVEILLVMDKSVVQRHGNVAAATLAFTVFNMVTALFSDNSIGLPIRLVLVSLLLLEHEQQGLNLSMDAKHLLHHFCLWQASLLSGNEPSLTDEDDNDDIEDKIVSNAITGHRHDHAVLLTALNFCAWKNEPCDTLGYAPIRGMCESRRSCSVTKDTGLSVAYTIAHEIGHNFGMMHDGDDEQCPLGSGHLMAPSLQPAAYGQFIWSDCSRRELEHFLTLEQSYCLNDQPSGKWKLVFPSVLPGEVYDADAQCQLQFGKKSKKCPLSFVKSICQMLWCQIDDKRCETKYLPAAEGTPCDTGKWCRKSKCVPKGENGPSAIDGQWSQWTQWSQCTRTCGSGIRRRIRKCDNPKSQYGGRYCEGNSTEHQLCNTQSCARGGIDIRNLQCATFNFKQFRGHYYTWTAYTEGMTGNSRCKLYCRAKGWDFVASLSDKVLDGTPCNTYNDEKRFQESSFYPDVVHVNNDVCVDGRCRKVGCDGRLDSRARLDRCGVCNGDDSSCKKSLTVVQHNSDVPCTDWTRCPASRWLINEWSPCIGCNEGKGGFQKRKVSCYIAASNGNNPRIVSRRICERTQGPKPIHKRNCRCPPRWVVSEWQPCAVEATNAANIQEKCGLGTKTRSVTCRQWYETKDEFIADDKCTGLELPIKPITSLPCRVPCKGRWVSHTWSQCSVSCGSGWRTRRVTCIPTTTLAEALTDNSYRTTTCSMANKPKTLMHCQLQPCPIKNASSMSRYTAAKGK
ncbi:hypothetical protein CHUAL_006347 [Chamberlinius hualienensis]